MVTLRSRSSQETGSRLAITSLLGDSKFMQRARNRIPQLLIFSGGAFLASSSLAQKVSQVITSEEKVREEMVQISRELGVTCTECHNVQNFNDTSKKNYQVSLQHMKLTKMLRDNGFDGKKGPSATCYMCHRGQLIPDYKEPSPNKGK